MSDTFRGLDMKTCIGFGVYRFRPNVLLSNPEELVKELEVRFVQCMTVSCCTILTHLVRMPGTLPIGAPKSCAIVGVLSSRNAKGAKLSSV